MRNWRAASGPATSASGSWGANAGAGMISALFCRKGGFDHVPFLVNKTLPGRPFRVCPGWEICFRFFRSGMRLDRLRRLAPTPTPVRLLAAPGHLEHRAWMIVVKPQVEVVKIGDRRRNAQAKTA